MDNYTIMNEIVGESGEAGEGCLMQAAYMVGLLAVVVGAMLAMLAVIP
jgi:hypothetical protein